MSTDMSGIRAGFFEGVYGPGLAVQNDSESVPERDHRDRDPPHHASERSLVDWGSSSQSYLPDSLFS